MAYPEEMLDELESASMYIGMARNALESVSMRIGMARDALNEAVKSGLNANHVDPLLDKLIGVETIIDEMYEDYDQ